MKIVLLLAGFMALLQGEMLNTQITPSANITQFKHITILDQKLLLFKTIEGLKFSEVSDLTYGQNKKKLHHTIHSPDRF